MCVYKKVPKNIDFNSPLWHNISAIVCRNLYESRNDRMRVLKPKMKEYYFDLHTHILPGLDDGAKDLAQTEKMLGMAYAEGIRRIMLTPHFGLRSAGTTRQKTEETFGRIKEIAEAAYDDLELFLGNEILFSPGTVAELHNGNALTLAGSDFVLVEFYPDESLSALENAVRTLIRAGYRPVIAHAERYRCLQKHPADAETLTALGATIQINSSNLFGGWRSPEYRCVKKLLQSNLVHFIGSDCHNDSSRRPAMREAAEKLLRFTDEETAEAICRKNGERVLQNLPL